MAKDIFIPLILIILLASLLNPFGFMAPMAVMTALVLIAAAFAAFSLILWREKGLDEREQSHIYKADRAGFILGSLVLVVAIVVQSLAHMLSPWLVIALMAMILAKAVALVCESAKR